MPIKDKSLQDRFLAAVEALKLKFPVAEIAKATGIGEPTVSIYLASKREVSRPFLKRFCEVYLLDFEYMKTGKHVIPEKKDNDNFSADRLFEMFLHVSQAQTKILESIERKMAQESTQAIIHEIVIKLDDKAKEIGTNLIRTLTIVESARIVQDRSQIELLEHLRKLKSGTAPPSQDEDKKSRQKNGDGQKRGKNPA